MAESAASVAWDSLPTVIGDPTELALVFHNLVSNAVKYRRPGVAPEVRLSARQADGRWRIEVDDNGMGIDQRHRERVFRVSQRLPGRSGHGGTASAWPTAGGW